MSPTSTSDAPRRASLARGAFLDVLAAAVALVFANALLVTPVFVLALTRSGAADPAAVDFEALTRDWLPQITALTVLATLLAATLTWALRARRLPSLAPMRADFAYPLAIGAGLLIQLGCVAISILSQTAGAPIAPSNADPVQAMARELPWVAWTLVVLVAPAAEELLFRHVLLRRFALAGRAALGLVVTGLVFAALHEPVPGDAGLVAWGLAVVLYVAMGTGFGLVYLRTGRLGAAIAAHAACNLLALVLATFSTF